MKADKVQIERSWKELLKDEFETEYFQELSTTLKQKKKNGITIYPPGPLIFNAFNLTPVDQVKVVIIGQDPYHGPGEAMGLSFSVPRGVRIPPSLRNIYKELSDDVDFEIPNHGDLSSWVTQGVFLLNAMLTVEHKNAGSHKNIGWQKFTDAVISRLSDEKSGLIFLLWGRFAQSKQVLIDTNKHHVLTAAHPSPLARGAYFGSRHFSKTNTLLNEMNKPTINWKLPD